MLMNIKCSMIPSVRIELSFDDGSSKDNLLSVGDLVDVLYNGNGLRKHIVGVVKAINTPGTDPKGWSILIDGSDDFDSDIARFAPTSILDLDIIRKNGTQKVVNTPIDDTGISAIRINKGRLQYSKNNRDWFNIKIDDRDIIVKDEGIIPEGPEEFVPPSPRPPFPGPRELDDDNVDEIFD